MAIAIFSVVTGLNLPGCKPILFIIHFCYRMKDSIGWHLTWISPRMESGVAHLALSAKPGSQVEKMLAVALENNTIHLWALNEDGLDNKIGIR